MIQPDHAAIVARVQQRLLADPCASADGTVDVGRVGQLAREEAPLLPATSFERLVDEVVAEVTGLGPLEAVLADPSVTEVMVNGGGDVWVERRGQLARLGLVLDRPIVGRLIERVVAPLGRRVDRASPLVDGRLGDGSRVNVVVPPVSVDGPCITIRRFSVGGHSLADFCGPPVQDLLRWAIRARWNIVVSGATGAGKTTLLNAAAGEIGPGERIITVEDAAELRLCHDHVVRLEARPANSEGAGEVTVRSLVRNALRMRPDRLVVGEVRGPEALDMVQAMNTGHDGSLSTCHANSAADALRRLETMTLLGSVALPIEAIREQLASAIDLVVHVGRGADGERRIVEVAEVVDPCCAADAAGAGTVGRVPPRTRALAGAARVLATPIRPARFPAGPAPEPS